MKEMSASRRKFLKESIRNLGGLSCIGLLLGLQQHQSLAQQNVVLRPPFALDDEKQFNAACIRCGQCVQACPYDILHLAGLLSPLPAGTPFLQLALSLVKCVKIFLVLKPVQVVH